MIKFISCPSAGYKEKALSQNKRNISFKAITEEDFTTLFDWLRVPHVAKWWYPDVLPNDWEGGQVQQIL